MFRFKSPVPFVIVAAIALVIFIVIMIATGGQGGEFSYRVEF